jgi:flagellar export protein FliJ
MAHFIFKLDGVLRHRKNIEHERQRELAVVRTRMTLLEQQLAALDAEVKASNDGVREKHLTGPLDLTFLAAHRRYLAATHRRALELAQKMAGVQRQVDAARQALAEAARDRKVLEKLRENQQEIWRQSLKQREMAEQDEITMQMSYRKTEP